MHTEFFPTRVHRSTLALLVGLLVRTGNTVTRLKAFDLHHVF